MKILICFSDLYIFGYDCWISSCDIRIIFINQKMIFYQNFITKFFQKKLFVRKTYLYIVAKVPVEFGPNTRCILPKKSPGHHQASPYIITQLIYTITSSDFH